MYLYADFFLVRPPLYIYQALLSYCSIDKDITPKPQFLQSKHLNIENIKKKNPSRITQINDTDKIKKSDKRFNTCLKTELEMGIINSNTFTATVMPKRIKSICCKQYNILKNTTFRGVQT